MAKDRSRLSLFVPTAHSQISRFREDSKQERCPLSDIFQLRRLRSIAKPSWLAISCGLNSTRLGVKNDEGCKRMFPRFPLLPEFLCHLGFFG